MSGEQLTKIKTEPTMTASEQAKTVKRIQEVLVNQIGDTSDLNETVEVIEEIVINVIPENYPGDPKAAMGYCWSNYETKEPGKDIEKEGWESVVLGLIKKNNAKKAWVNCMWPGGYTGEYPKAASKTIKKVEIKKESPKMVGWCDKCQSYCFGDCEA